MHEYMKLAFAVLEDTVQRADQGFVYSTIQVRVEVSVVFLG
jgi:hypothetical protein